MRRIFAALLLAVIIIGGTRRQMLAALRPSWKTSKPPGLRAGLWQYPLRFARDPMPENFTDFFQRVENDVPSGALIAVVVPPPWNDPRPGYARYRIQYLLAGHPVVITSPAVVDLDDDSYVAAWRVPVTFSASHVLYSGSGGVLGGPGK